MKRKNILALLLCVTTMTSFSQTDNTEKKWQVDLALNTVEPAYDFVLSQRLTTNGFRRDHSLSEAFNVSRNIRENFFIRISLKGTQYRVIETYDNRNFSNPSSDFELDTIQAKQNSISICPGILWKGNYKLIDFGGGFQLCYRSFGQIEGDATQSNWDFATNDTIGFIRNHQTEEGGYSLGIGPIASFGLRLSKRISIGGEFSSFFCYYKLGGEVRSIKTNVLTGFTDIPYETQQNFSGINFSPVVSSIFFSFRF